MQFLALMQYHKNYVLCIGTYFSIIYAIDFLPSFHTRRVEMQILLLLISFSFNSNDNWRGKWIEELSNKHLLSRKTHF